MRAFALTQGIGILLIFGLLACAQPPAVPLPSPPPKNATAPIVVCVAPIEPFVSYC
jgi:hypothetical protein